MLAESSAASWARCAVTAALAVALGLLGARPALARHLDCAAVRSVLARGKSPAQVAIQFQATVGQVLECKRKRDLVRHRSQPLRPTPIPERTDYPTPRATLAPAGRRWLGD